MHIPPSFNFQIRKSHFHFSQFTTATEVCFFYGLIYRLSSPLSGERVAKYASEHVFERLVAEEDFKNGNYNQALINSFIQTDADILNNPTVMEERSGATAVTCLITDTSIICVCFCLPLTADRLRLGKCWRFSLYSFNKVPGNSSFQ